MAVWRCLTKSTVSPSVKTMFRSIPGRVPAEHAYAPCVAAHPGPGRPAVDEGTARHGRHPPLGLSVGQSAQQQPPDAAERLVEKKFLTEEWIRRVP